MCIGKGQIVSLMRLVRTYWSQIGLISFFVNQLNLILSIDIQVKYFKK